MRVPGMVFCSFTYNILLILFQLYSDGSPLYNQFHLTSAAIRISAFNLCLVGSEEAIIRSGVNVGGYFSGGPFHHRNRNPRPETTQT